MFIVTNSESTAISWREAHADSRGLGPDAFVRHIERHPTQSRYAYLVKSQEEDQTWAQQAISEADAQLDTLTDDWYLAGTAPASQVFDEESGYVTDPGVRSVSGQTGHLKVDQILWDNHVRHASLGQVRVAGQKRSEAETGPRVLIEDPAGSDSRILEARSESATSPYLAVLEASESMTTLFLEGPAASLQLNAEDGSAGLSAVFDASESRSEISTPGVLSVSAAGSEKLTIGGGGAAMPDAGDTLTLTASGGAKAELVPRDGGGFGLGAQAALQAKPEQSKPLLRVDQEDGSPAFRVGPSGSIVGQGPMEIGQLTLGRTTLALAGESGTDQVKASADGSLQAGELTLTSPGKGLVLTAPDGSTYRLYPESDGTLRLEDI